MNAEQNVPPQRRSRVYLAGPDVFLPDPMAAAEAKKGLCREYGFEGVFPLDCELDLDGLDGPQAGALIARANEETMRSCDFIIANMTPFRGPSMDVGTAYEMGFMRALGRPVLGYTNHEGSFAARTRADVCIRQGTVALRRRPDGRWVDADDLMIEDFGLVDNLMMVGAVMDSGATICVGADRSSALGGIAGLIGFETCLRQAVSMGLRDLVRSDPEIR